MCSVYLIDGIILVYLAPLNYYDLPCICFNLYKKKKKIREMVCYSFHKS